MREAGKKQLIIGLVIAGVGLAISVGSYAAAAANGGGGYFLMFGLVIVGLMRAFRGYSMMKAAGSAPAAAAPAVAPAPMPAMPPQPQGDATPTVMTDRVAPTAASPSSPPPPPAPSSMWD